MLLGDAVADVPCAERVEREHQLRDVVEARHGASYGVDGLGKELSQPWRVIDIALISIFVGCPVAVLVADLGREELHGLGREPEGVPVQLLPQGVAAQVAHALPAALHRAALGLGWLRALLEAPVQGRRHPRRRCGGRPPRVLGKCRCQRHLALAEHTDALGELECVAARDAEIAHVGVLDLEQRLHVVEAVPDEGLGVLLEAALLQEDHHGVTLVCRGIPATKLHEAPPQPHRVAGADAGVLHVGVLDLR
mmetsp:Transcript_8105/g.25789  ORF Transcript_8105/g.25789 Transcript_8105/m.25789 type:complete len:251 (+) Transcript_8105:529-1281(+)